MCVVFPAFMFMIKSHECNGKIPKQIIPYLLFTLL